MKMLLYLEAYSQPGAARKAAAHPPGGSVMDFPKAIGSRV
jgi:hypothetical protein